MLTTVTHLQIQRELEPSAQRRGIQIETDVKGYDIYTMPMHGSELASILFNFYSNALKAIRRAKPEQGRILIRCGQEDKIVYIEFCDNGDGIPEELHERIFNPFFTTTTLSVAPFFGPRIGQNKVDAYRRGHELIRHSAPPPASDSPGSGEDVHGYRNGSRHAIPFPGPGQKHNP